MNPRNYSGSLLELYEIVCKHYYIEDCTVGIVNYLKPNQQWKVTIYSDDGIKVVIYSDSIEHLGLALKTNTLLSFKKI